MADQNNFQGSSMTMTREAGGSPIPIAFVYDVQRTDKPGNKIPIGSWEDTSVQTRPGRVLFSDWTFGVRLNPDAASQVALEACEISRETCTFILTEAQGTKKTKTFHGIVGQFGFTGRSGDIYQGNLSVIGTDILVRS